MTNKREKIRASVPFVNHCVVNIVMPVLRAREKGVRIEYSQNNQEFYRLSQKRSTKKKKKKLTAKSIKSSRDLKTGMLPLTL